VRYESPDEPASWYLPETMDSKAGKCAALARAIEDLLDRMPDSRGRAAARIASCTFPADAASAAKLFVDYLRTGAAIRR
jgi:predicted TPR repeat methyltransferase